MIKNAKQNGERTSPRILVIDDEDTILWLFEQILKPEGFEVVTARNGLEGLENYKRHKPDAILLDLIMPKMSGMEFLRSLRGLDKHVPVIILTGYGDAQSVRESVPLGVSEYIGKPFENTMVVKTLKAVCHRNGEVVNV